MSEIKLPEPEIYVIEYFGLGDVAQHIGYTSDQMKAAILEERERCARICEQTDEDGEGPDCWCWHSKDYASAIRGK